MIFTSNYRFLLFTLSLLFSLSFVNAACLNEPSSIEIISGSNSLGDLTPNQANLGTYIKSDLDENPLKVKLKFSNIESDCFASNSDIEMRLFAGGLSVSANSISNSGNVTVVDFNFNVDIVAPSSFVSNYVVRHKSNPTGTEGMIRFISDSNVPVFTQFAYQPSDPIIKPGTQIKLDYQIDDYGSGLESLIISGGKSQIINFENNEKSYSDSISEELTTSKTYSLKITDKLGNENSQEVEFYVDSSAPLIQNFEVASYSRDSSNTRYVSFSAIIKDHSFSLIDEVPHISADFSKINPSKSNAVAICERDLSYQDIYNCVWENIPITSLDKTSTVSITVSAKDSVDNVNEKVLNKEIFYDTQGPNINKFYLQNSIGQKNIFSAKDPSVIIYLEFDDESLDNPLKLNEFTVIDEFDNNFFVIPKINYSNGKASYLWNLTNFVQKYGGTSKGSLEYKVTIYDTYNNPTTKSINVTFNNRAPIIKDISFIENDYSSDGAISDGVISSKEKINFRMFVEGENLEFTKDFIFANFYPISAKEEMKKVAAKCNAYNKTTYQCDFTNIVVDNGHLESKVSFYVMDTAGNLAKEDFDVEIFAIGDEVPESFKIDDISITNVLNRHMLANPPGGVVDGWFEGDIKDIEGRPKMIIVNYQLKSCNDSAFDPMLLGERVLFPDEIVRSYGGEAQRDFIFKIEVKAHDNMVDLNTKKIDCKMAILKRDNTTLYPAEEVKFNVIFDFYDLPHNSLLNAQAQNILDMAEDARALTEWVEPIWGIYTMARDVCTTVQTVKGVMGSLSSGWQPISWVLHGFPPTIAAAKSGDAGITGTASVTTTIVDTAAGALNWMCKIVTCENGGLLGGFWSGTAAADFMNNIQTLGGATDALQGMCVDSSIPDAGSATDISIKTGDDIYQPGTESYAAEGWA